LPAILLQSGIAPPPRISRTPLLSKAHSPKEPITPPAAFTGSAKAGNSESVITAANMYHVVFFFIPLSFPQKTFSPFFIPETSENFV
jgi:hypothetical protein